jgi:L-lysine 2,3-aminomutase
MAAKKDWSKILDFIKNNPYIKELAANGIDKLIDFSKNGLPFRKKVVNEVAELRAEVEALKIAVAELLKDKIECDGND